MYRVTPDKSKFGSLNGKFILPAIGTDTTDLLTDLKRIGKPLIYVNTEKISAERFVQKNGRRLFSVEK